MTPGFGAPELVVSKANGNVSDFTATLRIVVTLKVAPAELVVRVSDTA
jgi:hypothetical protein